MNLQWNSHRRYAEASNCRCWLYVLLSGRLRTCTYSAQEHGRTEGPPHNVFKVAKPVADLSNALRSDLPPWQSTLRIRGEASTVICRCALCG